MAAESDLDVPHLDGSRGQYKTPSLDHDNIVTMQTDIAWIRRKIEGQCEWQKGTDDRISSLENWRSLVVGGLCVLGAVSYYGWVHFPG